MIVALFALMYFLMIRPQRKQQQKRREQLSKIKPGDSVVTIGRLHGVVDEINEAEKTVTLDCDGIYLVFDLSAVAQIKQPGIAPATATTDTKTNSAKTDEAPASDAADDKSAASDQASDSAADQNKESK
ncbi:preprotein translocase subunit YajC [Lentilactobacillus sp. IMAU92037]|uniref:preprotein translocase subunit YajC n=1 Tax=Lentilactobacillus TaxID=2767893 RepID=UPI001C271D0A|nr:MULTISPECIES: preprotein translocase subunit YajC [Lentilactobacillus]MBU9788095.1 preprotein translocase subunit YajC [Lentilactobacillus dabitei]MBV0930030.1 preprotein translocase subunit YajC [Lentilactobacillus dabitei]MDM7516209.1 preprotein translocase subunit YajC [Lentilactobacillus sp. TOM.63]